MVNNSTNCHAKREFFFQKTTLGYMTKTLIQIKLFFLHQNQNILFSNIGNQNIFLEKNHNPPFKLNGRSLTDKQNWFKQYFCNTIPHITATWVTSGTSLLVRLIPVGLQWQSAVKTHFLPYNAIAIFFLILTQKACL